jgi:hypothetical protein
MRMNTAKCRCPGSKVVSMFDFWARGPGFEFCGENVNRSSLKIHDMEVSNLFASFGNEKIT